MAKTTPPMTGLVHVTGEPDTGKTTLTLTTGVDPKYIAFIDDDLKTQSIADSFEAQGHPFGFYFNLLREFAAIEGQAPIDLFNLVKQQLDLLREQKKEKKWKVLVFDNWSRMEGGIRDFSMSIMGRISGLSPGQIKNMSMLTWPYTYNIYSEILDQLLSIAPLVFITTHIRDQYVGNARTGAKEPRGQRPLIEKSSFRVWLRHNPDSDAPIGLVLKRMVTINAETLKPVSVFPRRISPCDWETLERYIKDPIGDQEARSADEKPNAFELSILDGTLTEDQKNALAIARISMERELAEEKALADAEGEAEALETASARARAQELALENPDATASQIRKMMAEEEIQAKMPDVTKWVKEVR